MTLEDFSKYLDSFNKLPGEYTFEEITEIICAYRVLIPTSLKNWDHLVQQLGCPYSGESLRKKAARYLLKLPDLEDEIKKKFNIQSSEEDVNFSIKADLDILYKQEVRNNDLVREYRKHLREDARIEDLKNKIIEAAKYVENYIPHRFVENSLKPRAINNEAILLLSDWHIGALVDNFYNKFNCDIAEKELIKLVHNVIDYCDKFNVHRLNIINLGDLINGGIHINSRITQEFDVITQIEVAAQLLYKVVSQLELAAPEVTYRSCSDNHSRLMANKSEHIEKENFGRLIDWWLETKLEQGGHHIEVIRDNIDYGLGKFNLIDGKTVMFAHGHEDNINTVYQNFTGATKQFVDYILLGHYHNPKEKNFQDCKVIVNGSLVGTESYALSKRLFASPCQKLLIFDDNFIDISLNVNTRKGL